MSCHFEGKYGQKEYHFFSVIVRITTKMIAFDIFLHILPRLHFFGQISSAYKSFTQIILHLSRNSM